VIALDLESSQQGSVLILEVYSEAGDLVRTQRESALSAVISVEWDGRDELGVIQESGIWTLEAYVEDQNGNPSELCSKDVALRQNIMDYYE
jgi:flagellar hook assembly protein FlgD